MISIKYWSQGFKNPSQRPFAKGGRGKSTPQIPFKTHWKSAKKMVFLGKKNLSTKAPLTDLTHDWGFWILPQGKLKNEE